VPDQRDALLGRVALWFAAACVVVVAATVLMFALPAVRDYLSGRPALVSYVEGDLIDLPPAVYSSTANTIFLFSQFSCRACQASKPVMAAIVADLARRPNVQVVLVTDDASPEEEQVFAVEVGIDSSHVHRTDLRGLRLRLVPTIVLADKAGKILMAREGLLTESDRTDVVRMASFDRQP
jgi:hypothetical protein